MLKTLFKKKNYYSDSELNNTAQGTSMADMAAELLIAPTALMKLTLAQARMVVRYMQPQIVAQGTAFIREGDARDTGFMMLLIDGEVTVETQVASRAEPILLAVLGRGSLIGELSMLDGQPRYASCIAATPLRCAILTRESLQRLIQENPVIGAKLMLAIALRIALQLRDNTDKLKMYAQLTQAMQEELGSRVEA